MKMDTESKFEKYSELINSSLHNLVSKSEEIKFHIDDSITVFKDNNLLSKGNKVIDIGSGGGFPVIPLSIVFPEVNFCAVESNKKKTDFLTDCKNNLVLENLTVIRTRAEEYRTGNHPGPFDIAVCRAFSHLRALIEVSLPVLKKNGRLMAFKSLTQYENELEESQDLLKKIGGRLSKVLYYNLMKNDALFKGVLIIIDKKFSTPKSYPRLWKKIKSEISKQN